jgi:hypothetical protein
MALTRLGPNQSVNLASNVTGTLATGNGGTGATSFAPGKLLQVVNSSTDFDSTSSSNLELFNASITPSATSSKILITFSCVVQLDNDEYAKFSIYRGSLASGSAVFTLDDFGFNATGGGSRYQATGHYLDSPSTTSSQQYSIVGINLYSASIRYGAGANNPITLMEIGA